MLLRLGRFTVLAILASCGGSPASTPDGGDAAAPDGGPIFGPTAEPAPPALTPCADGLVETNIAGVAACGPIDESAASPCAPGEGRFGGTACAPIGPPCPADGFPADLPASARVLFVSQTAGAGADGSRARPYPRVRDALARAAAGDVVAVATGTYDEALTLPAGVELRGACASGTVLGSTVASDFAGTITVEGDGSTIRHVTVTGAARAGIWLDAASVTLDGVEIAEATGFGLVASFESSVTGTNVVIRDTAARADGYGNGIVASDGSTVTLVGADLVANRQIAVVVTGTGSMAELQRTRVAGTLPDEAGGFGRGLLVRDGGRGELRGTLVIANRDFAAVAEGDGSVLFVEGSTIAHTLPRERDGAFGRGVEVNDGARAEVRGTALVGNHEVTLLARDGTTIDLEDVLVADTRPAADGSSGIGLVIAPGGVATLRRAVIASSHASSMLVRGPDADVTLEDVVLRDNAGNATDGLGGLGLEALGGASVHGARARIERARETSIIAFDDGTAIELEDVAVVDTRARACAETTCTGYGAGIATVVVGGRVALARFELTRSAVAGVQLAGGALSLTSGQVVETPIGLNLQVPGVALEDVVTDVLFVDVERNVDGMSLPIPDPAAPTP